MVTLDIFGAQVQLKGGEWVDPPEELREDLDALVAYARTGPAPRGHTPDFDVVIAETAERLFKARILTYEPPPLKKGIVS